MPRRIIHHRDETYRIDRNTLLFWPDAHILHSPDQPLSVQLVPVNTQLLRMAQELGILGIPDSSEEQTVAAAIEGYRSSGYETWTINEALQLIVESPNTDLAAAQIECLEYWFFIEKLPNMGRQEPSSAEQT